MLAKTVYVTSLLSALVAAAPAPQVEGYSDADASFTVSQPEGTPVTSISGSVSQIPVCPSSLDHLHVSYDKPS
jgi:hypothetical protein